MNLRGWWRWFLYRHGWFSWWNLMAWRGVRIQELARTLWVADKSHPWLWPLIRCDLHVLRHGRPGDGGPGDGGWEGGIGHWTQLDFTKHNVRFLRRIACGCGRVYWESGGSFTAGGVR